MFPKSLQLAVTLVKLCNVLTKFNFILFFCFILYNCIIGAAVVQLGRKLSWGLKSHTGVLWCWLRCRWPKPPWAPGGPERGPSYPVLQQLDCIWAKHGWGLDWQSENMPVPLWQRRGARKLDEADLYGWNFWNNSASEETDDKGKLADDHGMTKVYLGFRMPRDSRKEREENVKTIKH